MNNTPINLRIKFKKVGSLQYISHLDLVRTMNKIIVRAGLPLWYTEGFNPKPKMVFAAPLSTGVESVCEFMDLRLIEHIEPSEAVRALNENMTDEMQVISAYYPTSKLTDLKWLSYTIIIEENGIDENTLSVCRRALEGDRIEIMKKSKSGEALTDIKPMIRSLSIAYDSGRLRISCILMSDSQSFLNPEYIVKYLKQSAGILSSENLLNGSYSIMRENAYDSEMNPFI